MMGPQSQPSAFFPLSSPDFSPLAFFIVGLYCAFIFVYGLYGYFWVPDSTSKMWRTFSLVSTVLLLTVLSLVIAQSSSDSPAASTVGTQTSWRPLFTAPLAASKGQNM